MISTLPKALVIVAHPDDEALFFFATIRRLRKAGISTTVIVATGRFRSARNTRQRMEEFSRSCQALGVEAQSLGLKDRLGLPLNQAQLRAGLSPFAENSAPLRVYTHNPWGEYGHPHHASVALAVSQTFRQPVYFLAGPTKAERSVNLSPNEYRAKLNHLKAVYKTQGFAWTWCTGQERVVHFSPSTVHFLTRFSIGRPRRVRPRAKLDSRQRSIVLAYLRAFSDEAPTIPEELRHIPYGVWAERIKRYWDRLRHYLRSERSAFVQEL